MVTIPGAKLLCLSTPYAQAGVLYETHRQHFGQEHDEVLVWQAPSRIMNPTIPELFIAREKERDPQAARSEWDATFREDLETAFSLEMVEACIIPGRGTLPPTTDIGYQAFVDPSGGRADAFTLAIGHYHRDGRAIIDCIRAWIPPFSPEAVVGEAKAVLATYRVSRVTGDRYAGEWPREAFSKHGIVYEEAALTKSELYVNLIPALTSTQVELPEDRMLLKELRQLERRRGRTGRDTIDHPAGAHDDLANAVAGLVYLLRQQAAVPLVAPDAALFWRPAPFSVR